MNDFSVMDIYIYEQQNKKNPLFFRKPANFFSAVFEKSRGFFSSFTPAPS